MADICPTCGRTWTRCLDAVALLELLKNGTPHREVYHGRDGGWFVTYGGGEVAAEAVRELRESGEIVSVYSDCPDDAYHVGKTLDVKATAAERKSHRRAKDAPLVYTDGSKIRR